MLHFTSTTLRLHCGVGANLPSFFPRLVRLPASRAEASQPCVRSAHVTAMQRSAFIILPSLFLSHSHKGTCSYNVRTEMSELRGGGLSGDQKKLRESMISLHNLDTDFQQHKNFANVIYEWSHCSLAPDACLSFVWSSQFPRLYNRIRTATKANQ